MKKRSLFLLSLCTALLLSMTLLAACSSGEEQPPAVDGLIGEDKTTSFVLVRSDSSNAATPSALTLKEAILERCGVELELTTDFVARAGSAGADKFKEHECEILIGDTVRDLSVGLKSELPRGLDWGIAREGTKIAIYGTDCLDEAIQYFLDNYVRDGNIYIADGERYINMGDYELDVLTINGRDINEFVIQYDTDVTYYPIIAKKLAVDLYEMAGCELTVEPMKVTDKPIIYFGTIGSAGTGKAACYVKGESLYAVCGSQGNPYDSYAMLLDYIKTNAVDKKVDIPADLNLSMNGDNDVVGSSEEPNLWIYKLDNGLMVREAEFDSGKGGDPVTIVQVSDMHFNYCNQKDLDENDPVLMSTLANRKWLANGSSVANAERCLAYAADADQIVVTGDTLDYLSWGCIELMQKTLWDKYPDAIATIGNHEPVRRVQGEVAETTTLEERYTWLEEVWAPYHDIYYFSKVIDEKVMIIQMDNSQNKYWDNQIEPFKADLETAREKGYTVLLFQHIPLCSNNPDEATFYPLRVNDGSGVPRNLYNSGIGAKASGATQEIYDLIVNNADLIKGIFCGHIHSDYYSEIIAKTSGGEDAIIPQYILTAAAYDSGHVFKITVK
ncbi:MAG: metallophosphoesterase [Clostridia bacterium]|nr:metallophosphoesterase [Clostridia bacterium]